MTSEFRVQEVKAKMIRKNGKYCGIKQLIGMKKDKLCGLDFDGEGINSYQVNNFHHL